MEKFNPEEYNTIIVDDCSIQRMIAEYFVKNIGYSYEKCSSGEEVLEIIQGENNRDIHVILSDVEMPDMNGFELCKIIKKDENTTHIPVIFLTASDDKNLAQKVQEAGGYGYLKKYYELKDLEEITRKAIQDTIQK